MKLIFYTKKDTKNNFYKLLQYQSLQRFLIEPCNKFSGKKNLWVVYKWSSKKQILF